MPGLAGIAILAINYSAYEAEVFVLAFFQLIGVIKFIHYHW